MKRPVLHASVKAERSVGLLVRNPQENASMEILEAI